MLSDGLLQPLSASPHCSGLQIIRQWCQGKGKQFRAVFFSRKRKMVNEHVVNQVFIKFLRQNLLYGHCIPSYVDCSKCNASYLFSQKLQLTQRAQ